MSDTGPAALGDSALQPHTWESISAAVRYQDSLTSLALPHLGDSPIELGSGLGDYAAAGLAAGITSWPCPADVAITGADGTVSPASGEMVFVAFCDEAPVARLDERSAAPACSGQRSVGIMPRSLGAWTTPEGDRMLLEHRIEMR